MAQSTAPRQQQEGITPRSLFCLGSETAREAGPGKVTASGISLPSLLLGNPRDYSARGPGSGGGGGRWSPAAFGPLGGHASGDVRGPGTERCRCAWRQRRGVRCSPPRSGAPAPPPTPRTPRQMRAMAGAGRAPRPRLAGLRHPLLPSASRAASGSPRSRGSELHDPGARRGPRMRSGAPLLFGRFHGYEAGPLGVSERENEAQEPPASLLPTRYEPGPLRPRVGPWFLALVGVQGGRGRRDLRSQWGPQGVIPVGQQARCFLKTF